MRILIMGPQGCGKTTQAKILAQRHNLTVIKTGDMLRKALQEGGEEARVIKTEMLDEGGLIDDGIVAGLVKKAVLDAGNEGFVMDGYPRRLSQLKLFDPHFDRVFFITLNDNVALTRMQKRGRVDDSLELIGKRLAVYHRETVPVIGHYKGQGILHQVRGEGSVEEIAAEIEGGLQ